MAWPVSVRCGRAQVAQRGGAVHGRQGQDRLATARIDKAGEA